MTLPPLTPHDVHTPPPEPPPAGRGKLWVALLVLAALGLGAFLLLRGRGAPPPEPTVADAPDAGVAEPVAPTGDPDAAAREHLARASTAPEWATWLSTPGFLQRCVAAVAAVAEGESPRPLVPFLAPQGPFTVEQRGGRTFMDPQAAARYDTVTRVVRSLDARVLAAGYRALGPFVDAAYRELAPPGRRFEDTLGRGMERLLAVPVPEGPVELTAKGGGWAFADADLEGRSAAEKHLLRFGAQNQRDVQAKLREVREALGGGTGAPDAGP